MSVFTEAELAFLQGERRLARLATVGRDGTPHILARVALEEGTYSDAVRVASERLDSLMGMATIGCQVPWERMQGFIHAQDGRIISHQFFVYEEEQYQSREALTYTAAQIGRMVPRIAPLMPVQDPSLKDIIDALHWWRAGREQPSAASVLLNVRILDLIASRVGEDSWTTYLEKYVKNLWIHETMLDALYHPLFEALHNEVEPDRRAVQRKIFLEAMTYDAGREAFEVARAGQHLDTIIDFIPPRTPLGRDLRTIKRRTSSSAAVTAWCSESEGLWKRALHRLERIRNAVAHGGPFTEQAVLLIQPASQRIVIWSLWECVDGFLAGKTLLQSHADMRTRWDSWRASTQTARSLEDVLK